MNFTSRGYTLVEVLAVLVMAGVLTGFAITSWNRSRGNLEASSLVGEIQSGLQAARFEAIKRNRPVAFTLESGQFVTRVKSSTAPTTCGNQSGDIVLNRISTSNFQFSMNAGGGMMWAANGLTRQCGSTAFYAGTIGIREGTATVRSLVISSAGRVQQQ
jgi:prepilin-type N-terminal cleavage/methylation domain-containing protein